MHEMLILWLICLSSEHCFATRGLTLAGGRSCLSTQYPK
jgi:hypothetical protein